MSLTEKDAFKLGFLSRCAEERLVGRALEQRIAAAGDWAARDKKASELYKYVPPALSPGDIASAGFKSLGSGALALLAAPFAAVPVIGAGAGYGAAKMIEPQISDDDIKAQELAATYKLYADKAKARRKSRKNRNRDL